MGNYLKEILQSYQENDSWKGFIIKLRYDKQLLSELIDATSFLPDSVSNSERLFYLKENLSEIQLCPYCKTRPLKFKKLDKGFYATCGCSDCQKQGMSKGAKTERDWNIIQSKMKATYKKRTGFEHNMQNPEFKKTFFDKYEKSHSEKFPVNSEKAIEHRNDTIKEKYGSVGHMLLQGTIKKYGSVSNKMKLYAESIAEKQRASKLKELISKIEQLNFRLISINGEDFEIECKDCGHIFHLSRPSINIYCRKNIRFCPKCNYKNMTFRSGIEKEIGGIISSFYTGEIRYNKYIGGVECDISIPELKIAIEVNGCYWHSEEYKEKNFHIEKKKKIEEQGYNLIQIWEDDWNSSTKKNIIISRLKSKLGLCQTIGARKCETRMVSGSETKKFLEENHLQGYTPSTYNFGLYWNNELVEIATIGKSRKLIGKRENAYELYRLCTKQNLNVIGGFSKLLKSIKSELPGETLISYSDCDWCKISDNGYSKIGFMFDHLTPPDYHWLVDNIRENRLNYTKQKLVAQGEDSSLSEVKIMHNKGFKRIFGSGNLMFRIKL